MGKSVGKALESALKDKEVFEKTIQKKSKDILSNGYRRAIFSELTLSPCMNIAEISRRTQINANTVGWHIDRLIKSGYVVERRVGGRRIYFPEGLVLPEEVPLFHALSRVPVRILLTLVFKNPGSSQRELSEKSGMSHQSVSKMMKYLVSSELISSVSDGSHIRYYPTKLLSEKSEGFYNRSKRYAEFLMKKLKESGGREPKIVKKSIERIILELGPKGGKYTMETGINPYMTYKTK
jgi:predicted transcriptional regulator